MAQRSDAIDVSDAGVSRFELAPPRRFLLPAILLLLSERPAHGYGLVPELARFGFGHVDRPAVYRALAQLERDGMVTAPGARPEPGRNRRVYRVTPLGSRVLRAWMDVIKEEHDRLESVLRRYQATGSTDAVLAAVEGGWSTILGTGWSTVAPTGGQRWHLVPPGPRPDQLRYTAPPPPHGPAPGLVPGPGPGPGPPVPARFVLDPSRSAILVEVRSTVGPLSFGATGLCGHLRAAVSQGNVLAEAATEGRLTMDISALRSGNPLFDAELLRRIDARRFPTVKAEVRRCLPYGNGRCRLEADLTVHGLTRSVQGTVQIAPARPGRLVISGEQTLDIRDYAIPSPTVLMLRIYPDFRVRLHVEAEQEDAT